MELTTLASKIGSKIKPFLEEKKSEITTHRCCIYFTPNHVELVHINKKENAIELLEAQSFTLEDRNNLPLVLSSFVEKNNLNNVPVYWLLAPDDYQIFLIDALPVPEEEIRSALTWRIRSLISYPVENAAVDYFTIPAKKAAPDQRLITAVAAQKNELENTIKLIKDAGLHLAVIDIPELSLKNLSDLYEEDEKCTAYVYITSTIMILNITREKTLYFTRHINLPYAASDKDLYSSISLEMLRYFDYFQSQWRLPSPTRIFVTAEHRDATEIAKLLTENFLIQVNVFSLAPLLEDVKARNLLESRYLLAFGCALREGYQRVPTTD